MQNPEAIQEEIDVAKSKIEQNHLLNNNKSLATATSSSNSSETNKLSGPRLFEVKERSIFGFSLLVIDENSFILHAMTESKNKNFSLPSKNKSDFPEAFAELEVELSSGKRVHLLIFRARDENGDSHHIDFFSWIRSKRMEPYLADLGIIKIVESTIYSVTGEAELKISKKELEKDEPINLSDLNVKFNSKGTISDKYKPFCQVTRLKGLDSDQMLEKMAEYNRKKSQGEINSCPSLDTFIPEKNWFLHKWWDIDVKLHSPEHKRNISMVVDSKPDQQSPNKQELHVITSSGYSLYQSNCNTNKANVGQAKESKEAIDDKSAINSLVKGKEY